MSQRDYQATMDALSKQHQEVTASPEAARAFLIELGVLTKSGKVAERYKNLCIPRVQA